MTRTSRAAHKTENERAVDASALTPLTVPGLITEQVPLDALRPHPRNYQSHPEDEVEHIAASIREHGVYRPVVVARDGTILAGHGVVQAARSLGYTMIAVVRVPYDPESPPAIKLLTGDNEIRHLAEVDDRALTELLRELSETADLLGTGYDAMMLANLALVTRTADEITDLQAAQEWAGMPEYDEGPYDAHTNKPFELLVKFANETDRDDFSQRLGLEQTVARTHKTIWWPHLRRIDDPRSLRFMDGDEESEDE